jgi:coenzyme F420-reducing hydrogenase alpha subunit
VGGFYRTPSRRELEPLAEHMKRARDAALATVRWVAGFDFPDRERDYTFVALRHPAEYPFNEGHIVSNRGLDITSDIYGEYFEEKQVARSTALRSRLRDGSSYLVGPLARYALNFDRLSPEAARAARDAGLGPVCRNPYQSIVVRAVEVLHACGEALRIIESYEQPDRPAVAIEPRAGIGFGATEAPRGLLYHRYRLETDGTIAEARIVPPTSQNQACIEEDLMSYIGGFLDLPDETVRHRCEQTVRNYDPCISCATHFLRLDMDRG